jgi:F-type H+-transporting ATPase subunit b
MDQTIVLAAAAGESSLKLFFFHDLGEVIVTGLASVIIFALLWWKVTPFARKALAGRTERIAAELDGAEKARTAGEARLAEVQARVASAEDERQRIIVEARQTAAVLKDQILERARSEAEALKVRAAGDIEAGKRQAIADLQDEVAVLALGAAEAVVARNLDPATQNELIDGYIEQVGGVRS